MDNQNLQQFMKKNYPEWSDNERMQALFASFRLVNDDGCDKLFAEEANKDKFSFWKKVIFSAQKEKLLNQNDNILTFPGKHLDYCFMRNGLTPSCLGSVVVKRNLI